jgi:hypothetical protein
MDKRTCGIDGCDSPVKARGWCNLHWIRWQRYGNPLAAVFGPTWPTVCRVDGCDRETDTRGLCQSHYSRWKRTGNVGADVPVVPRLSPFTPDSRCTVEGCEKAPHGGVGGLCHAHFERWRRNGDVNAAVPVGNRVPRYAPGSQCAIDGCENSPSSGGRGWCGKHYMRWRTHGDVLWEPPPLLPVECLIEGCVKKSFSRGLCGAHYMRLRRYGDAERLVGKSWDVFYVVSDGRVVKFGITTGDPRRRLREHAAQGYTHIVRLAPGLPGTVAPDAESAIRSALALAGEKPVKGREYFDASCLALVLDVAESWLSSGGGEAA